MIEARAVKIVGKGDVDVLTLGTLGVPEPGPGEIRVAIAAAGLNRSDVLQRRGFYAAPPGFPSDVPGLEYAGRVEKLGEGVREFALGDPVMGIVGGVIIVKCGASLCKHAAFDLLNVELSTRLEDGIRSTLERLDDVRVSDLHVWSLGRGARGCVVTLISAAPRESAFYREQLARFGLAHLTVEVRRCTDGHGPAPAEPTKLGALV